MFQTNPNKILLFFFTLWCACSCGVKAHPTPPTVAPPISNGVPNYYKKNDVEQVKSKYNPKIEENSGTESDNVKE